MFNDVKINTGIEMLTSAAVSTFSREATARQIERQKTVFMGEKHITNVLTPEQEKLRDEGKDFVPDIERALEHGEGRLKFGISHRLKGAYACYKTGDQLECIRHILLAMGSIFDALGWNEASSYIDEQNFALYERNKRREVA